MTPASVYLGAATMADAEMRADIERFVRAVVYETMSKVLTDFAPHDPLLFAQHSTVKSELNTVIVAAVAAKLTRY